MSERKWSGDQTKVGENTFLQYKELFDSMQEGFAVHELICDEANRPINYRFLDVNQAFEKLTGFTREQLVGKTVREVMPATENYWIARYGEVTLTGQDQQFEAFAREIGRHYSIYAYSPRPGCFATIFSDITERIQKKEALQQEKEILEQNKKAHARELDIATASLTAQNEELIAQNEEITAMNEEIATLNQNLTGMNEELEQRVAERTVDLTAAHQELTAQYEELRQAQEAQQRSAEVQDVLREIAEAALLASSLNELYATVHQLVQRILPARNLYISLLDEEKGQLVRPYCVDESKAVLLTRPIGKGLSEYCMRMGHTVHVSSELFAKLRETGEVTLYYAPVFECLGAPLRDSREKIFGAITIYLTEDMQPFEPEDSKVLTIVAAQVSMAIERKRAEEALIESEARYRAIIEQAPEAVLLIDPETGEIIEANARFTERFGYDLRQNGPLSIYDFIVDKPATIANFIGSAKKNGVLPVQRRVVRHRNGFVVTVERSATLVRYRGRVLLTVTFRDVSDEVRREQEIHRDAQLATRVQLALLSAAEPSDYLEISTIFQPLGYVGGDLYFLDWRYDGSLLRGFLIDATGHGLGTALHTASLHALLREVNERDLPLSDTMRWLNIRAAQYFDEGTFAGALGFELDLQTRQLRWTCAGISTMWVSTKAQQGAIQCPGMSLGIRKDETFETHTLPVDVGDSLYFMTDGLADLLEGRPNLPLEQHSEMVGLLRTLSKSKKRRDDTTAVCIHVRSLPQSLVRQDGWPRTLHFNGYGDYQRFKGEVANILMEIIGLPHSLYEVAVHEALANAMECRDGVPRQHKARLRFNKVGNRLVVRVKTSRIGFAGNAILRRLRSHPEDMFSFGEDAAMGRGIPMMLSVSHQMIYNSEGTEVLLAWKL